MLQVITWPMGFILLAKGESKLFLFVDAAWTSGNLALSWLCIKYFGLVGAGIAFFASYILHALIVYPIVRRLTGFRWSVVNLKLCGIFLPLTGLVLCGLYLLPFWLSTSLGVLATLFSGIYSIRILLELVPLDRIPRVFRRAAMWLRLAPASILSDVCGSGK
jgi:PST family polysaccharide transporter